MRTASRYVHQPTPTSTLCGWLRLDDNANREFARSQGLLPGNWSFQSQQMQALDGSVVPACVIWKAEIFPSTDAVRKYRLAAMPHFMNAIYVCARALDDDDDGPEFRAGAANLHVDPELVRALTS